MNNMCLILNDKDCIRWVPDDGSTFWTETKREDIESRIEKNFLKRELFPKFMPGEIYASDISFFIFKTTKLLFDNATRHDDLSIWMGDVAEDATAEAFVAQSSKNKETFLVDYIASWQPFMILEEKILIENDTFRKIHILQILNKEKTGWIYAPNKQIKRIIIWSR